MYKYTLIFFSIFTSYSVRVRTDIGHYLWITVLKCLFVDTICDIVEAYSSSGFVTTFYIEGNLSLYLPYLVEERTLRMYIVLNALAAVLSM